MKEWKPNAPELTKKFNRSHEAEAPRRVVSKAELEMLERQRKSLAPQHNLPGPKPFTNVSNAKANTELENQIKYVRERLSARQGRASHDHQRALFFSPSKTHDSSRSL